MDDDTHIFAELNGYYHLLTMQDGDVRAAGPRCTVSQFDGLTDGVYSGHDVAERLPSGMALTQPRYELVRDDDMLVLVPRGSIRRRKAVEESTSRATYLVSRFRLGLKNHLIERLYAQTISLGDYVRAWSDYFLFDDCSLWPQGGATLLVRRTERHLDPLADALGVGAAEPEALLAQAAHRLSGLGVVEGALVDIESRRLDRPARRGHDLQERARRARPTGDQGQRQEHLLVDALDAAV
ncbi:MAG: hypothetical protein AAF525_09495, partial [Pseudomonadota bacterium]